MSTTRITLTAAESEKNAVAILIVPFISTVIPWVHCTKTIIVMTSNIPSQCGYEMMYNRYPPTAATKRVAGTAKRYQLPLYMTPNRYN